ncbi:MAG: UDP-3-O-[3-hydroxymyristoyl] N-acetylglucosamine deacetylase [Alphaproteobacteria bacterium]|nr:UDP-3-O-[3-hydroxymyristoyl] N-acetylglucosamine deacetylase [Alphaproteobacteria bacterium]
MSESWQQTVGGPVTFHGVGLHDGVVATVTLRPGRADGGIQFRRIDLGDRAPPIPARHSHVVETRLRTSIGSADGVTVATVEHLMAALAGLEIDNAVIEIDGPELPIMDGSAAPFVALIDAVGLVAQDAPRRGIRVLKLVRVDHGAAHASLEPGEGLVLDLAIDHAGTPIGRQHDIVAVTPRSFRTMIAPARTYGFLDDVDALRAAGFGRGGSLDNAVVVARDRVLNPGGLRHANEFVRHKILDALGDLYLAGAPLIGRFIGRRSGHGLNNALLRALFADPDAWRHEALGAPAPDRVAEAG